ncbi:DNA polymerase alpha-binding protein [Spathaspora sp. JA1]|nr:DNA polymerase alpha-binding protein [Spathaspora sp. JA1]
MSHKKITAFPDGNSYVHYNSTSDRLLIGNSEGLIKVFDISQPELEPTSIDIIDNLTSFTHDSDSNLVVVTSTSGQLELIDLSSGETKGVIYRSELPLRDAEFINSGKRIVCGGDDDKLIVMDVENSKVSSSVTLPDQLVNLGYNFSRELISVCLSNGDIQIYSVVNEQLNLLHSLKNVVVPKINTSLDKIDFQDENHDELICSKSSWSNNGRYLLLSSVENEVHVYEKDWKVVKKFDNDNAKIVDFALSSNGKHLVILSLDGFKIFEFDSGNVAHEDMVDFDGFYPLNVTWRDNHLFIGTTNGEVLSLKNIVSDVVSNLFVHEAEESDAEKENDDGNDTDALLRDSDDEEEEEEKPAIPRKREYKLHEEDSLIIDEDDDEEEIQDLPVKKAKLNGGHNNGVIISSTEIKPYSPGSTPFNSGSVKKRYLTMNNLGYVWIVKTVEQQSITVSFFDRALHREYNFLDYSGFNLASLNSNGILLGKSDNGLIYYRDHDDVNNWERKIPLVNSEIITSICISNSSEGGDDLIVVGTSFGYLRVFDQFGLCINVIKTLPVISLIASSRMTLFMINQVGAVFTYSIIELGEFKYYQQNIMLPLKQQKQDMLIKGVFFNEYDDPVLVGGEDDTVLVLHQWRQNQNSKWIPVLNCHDVIVGGNKNRKNWNCWPLGLIGEQLNCLILKNGDSSYPGFPLPLPVEIDIEMPIVVREDKKDKKKKKTDDLGFDDEEEEEEQEEEQQQQDNAEENFVRSLTFGKLLSETLNDSAQDNKSDIMDKLNEYATLFDKSLLKLFGEACKQSQLNKAWNIVKMIKKDKAMYAAFRIAERMQFANLANKIRELRELSLEDSIE